MAPDDDVAERFIQHNQLIRIFGTHRECFRTYDERPEKIDGDLIVQSWDTTRTTISCTSSANAWSTRPCAGP